MINRQEFPLRKRRWIYPFLILAAGFCYYISFFNYGINLLDEGYFVEGARRVLDGELPMSHFLSYPPGSYFILAALYKMFGVNVLISRFLEMVFLLINGLMVFHVSKRILPEKWALFPTFLYLFLPGFWPKVFFTFGLLLTLIALFRYLERRSAWRAAGLGWSLGIALVFKFEPALFALFAFLIVLSFDSLWHEGVFCFQKKRILGFLKGMVILFLAALSIIVPFLAYYHYRSALPGLLNSIKDIYGFQFLTGMVDLSEKPSLLKAVTRFHIRSQKHLFFFLVVLLYLILSFKLFVHVFVRRKKDFPALLPILVMGVLSLSYAYCAFSKLHFFQSVTLAYVCFGFVLHSLAQRRNLRSKIMLGVGLIFLGLYGVDNFAMKGYFHTGSISTRLAIKKEGGGLISSSRGRVYVGREELKVVEDLRQFFEGKNGYLLPLFYDPMVNFLTERKNPTRFTHLYPSFAAKASIQKEVIEAIEKYQIEYLLLGKGFWTGEAIFTHYAPGLTEYVKRHYRVEREIGFYLIFSRSEEREGVESRRSLGYERQHVEATLGRAGAMASTPGFAPLSWSWD